MEWDKAFCYLLGSIVANYCNEYVCVCVDRQFPNY